MKNRFTEEQIIGTEAGTKVAERCSRHGIFGATYYLRKDKYANMTVPEAKRLKALKSKTRN